MADEWVDIDNEWEDVPPEQKESYVPIETIRGGLEKTKQALTTSFYPKDYPQIPGVGSFGIPFPMSEIVPPTIRQHGVTPIDLISLISGGLGAGGAKFQKLRTAGAETKQALGEVSQEIGAMGKVLKTEPTPTAISSKLNLLKTTQETDTKSLIKDFKTTADSEIRGLEGASKRLEEIATSKSKNIVTTIRKEYPKIAREASKKYGELLKPIEETISEQSPLNSYDADNLLNQVEQQSLIRGATPEIINKVRIARSRFQPQQMPDGTFQERPITFGELKKVISDLRTPISREIKAGERFTPDDVLGDIVQDNWGYFLKDKIPENVKSAYDNLQAAYAPFAQSKKAIGQLFKPYKGDYAPIKNEHETILNFARGKLDEHLQNTIKALTEGIDQFAPGIKGLKEQIGEVGQIISKQQAAKETIPIIEKSRAVNIAEKEKQLGEYVTNLLKWKNRVTELEEQSSRINENKNKVLQSLGSWLTRRGIKIATTGKI